ncbi:MAG: DUF6488 family protein [Cellvibrio sp.]|uniref:DUF6488 family protein n=1 Tax=Cellvibrio sp. TaxID=1965322 RepID=UPI00271A8BAE|nr:DUF6488 family protein [Cellvibrio sp.]
MKKLAALLLMSVLGSVQLVTAHEDHEHAYITESAALVVAQKALIQLTEKDAGLGFGKLPANWAEVPAKNVKLHKNGDGYYIVAATNDAEGKTLYVLLSSEDGAVYDANFTGEFQKLK